MATAYQGQGIGQQLIQYGLTQLKALATEIVLTYGDPNFYCKVGFKQISEDEIKAPCKLSYPSGWMAQSLTDHPIVAIEGETDCIEALSHQHYW